MLKRIDPSQVRLGMYIEVIEGAWVGPSFWRSRFLLNRPTDVMSLRSSGVESIVINTSRGVDVTPSSVSQTKVMPESTSNQLKLALATIEQSGLLIREMFEDARMGGAVSLENVIQAVKHVAESTIGTPKAVIEMTRLKSRDEYTFLHSIAVTALMVHLGRHLELDEDKARYLGMGGMLHDVGKMKVPLNILNKTSKLTDDEMGEVRKHPTYGYNLLARQGDMPDVVLDICLHHHERIDGGGYPSGLAGEQISLSVRIASICDVYDALTSKRAYKKAWMPRDAAKYMTEQHGQFDLKILRQFFISLGF